MRLSEHDLLELWAVGETQHPIDRALTALSSVCGVRRGALADLPIGERDARLFELGRALAGARVAATAACPVCRETVEMALDLDVLEAGRDEGVAADVELEHDGVVMCCRQPTSRDLAFAAGAASDAEARARLIAACVTARAGDTAIDPAALADDAIERVEDALGEMQPPAETVLALACPACETTWLAPFDIGDVVWTSIRVAAQRTMNEVVELARAYGWSEDAVLALPASRRRYYAERA